MTPPSNAGGEGREVLARKLCEQHGVDPDALASGEHDCWDGPLWTVFVRDADEIMALFPSMRLSARENADDRAPALVEAAVAEMRERAAGWHDAQKAECSEKARKALGDRLWDRAGHFDLVAAVHSTSAAAIRALPTPSQEASNVG